MIRKTIFATSVAVASILFSGCAESMNNFANQMAKLNGAPLTQSEMIQQSDDKQLSEALSVLFGNKEINIGTVKHGVMKFRHHNFVKFSDKINNEKLNDKFTTLIENAKPVSIYLQVAKARGNTVKAYSGYINNYVFGDDVNTYMRGDNVVYIFNTGPTFIEFDNNGRIVSILAHHHAKYRELNNPSKDTSISLDSEFFIVTGDKAKSKQLRLNNKLLEEKFLYSVK